MNKKIQVKNLGFNIQLEREHSEDTDWVFGADTPKSKWEEAVGLVSASFAWASPDSNGIYQRVSARINHCWCFFQEALKKYFPIGQLQNLGGEKSNCVVNGFNNEIEKQLNYANDKKFLSVGFLEFLHKYDFFHEGKIRLNNRIGAIGSGTTRNGNSLKAVIQWISNYGIFPQSLDPEDVPMSFDEYYSKELTDEVLSIGQESLKYITINYAKVSGVNNYVEYADGFKWKIFDNYKDAHDGDFIKQLAPNYELLNYGYKLIINETGFAPIDPKKKGMINIQKFKTDTKVYYEDNLNPKNLIWAGNEKTLLFFFRHGWLNVKATTEQELWAEIKAKEIDDSLKPNYNISSGVVIVNYILNALVNLLGGKK